MSADEIRKMSPEDRRKLLQELRLELIKLRAQASMGTLDKPHKIKLTRKNIARILTVEREEMFRGEVGEEKKR
ncbi:MAG: 50S ribosomal protein L29 [Desulfurococcaceae archaeon]|nr:50S ribosomal protein L29 [Desulfurococcaceae archaeon]